MPETRDSDFSWKDFQARHNNELADILGNFVNRTAIFCHKYFDGRLPKTAAFGKLDDELIDTLKKAPGQLGELIDKHQYKNYVRELMNVARFANKYFNDKEPWKTRTENSEDCANTIHLCMQTVRILGILMEPLIPFSAGKIRQMLNIPDKEQWDSAAELRLQPDHVVNTPQILFSKIEDDIIAKEIEKLQNVRNKKAQQKSEDDIKTLIEFDDFSKLDLRVARVITAEKVPKTDKLLKLTVDIGIEQRTIVSGIAEQYKPEDLAGKNIVIIANLKPAKIRGIESKGMLLTSENDGRLSLLTVMSEIPAGSKIS